jgi:hypothetical protein
MGHGQKTNNVSEYRFMKRAGLVTEGRRDEFEALAGRCAVFLLDGIQ